MLEFWAPEGYTVDVTPNAIDFILSVSRESPGVETGGILVGRYTRRGEAAVVEGAYGPPKDSRRGPSQFWRGTAGVDSRLKELWEAQAGHYLGEWHYHPSFSPVPSGCDIREMMEIAGRPGYSCPEPILLIVGGDEDVGWEFSLRVFEALGHEVVLLRRYRPTGLKERLAALAGRLSLASVAEAVGVTSGTVRRWRRGSSLPNPSNRLWLRFFLDAVDGLETSRSFRDKSSLQIQHAQRELVRLVRCRKSQAALRLLEDS